MIISLYLQLDTMSNTVSDSQSSNNQSSSATEDSKDQVNSNENEYTQRQKQSSFQPSAVTFVFLCNRFPCFFFLQNVEEVTDQLHSLNVASKVTMRVNA